MTIVDVSDNVDDGDLVYVMIGGDDIHYIENSNEWT